MTHAITRLALIVSLLVPGVALARGQHETNVNTRYKIESVSMAGVPASSVSTTLRRDMQKLVGERYDPDAAETLADRIRQELPGYTVAIKVGRGDQPKHVKVTFDVDRIRNRRFDVRVPPLLYYKPEGFSGALALDFDTHHNNVSVGVLSTADELLERNAGVRLRYEHRRVGTDAVQIGVEYDWYHQTFEPETANGLSTTSLVTGLYRRRQNFAPSVSVLPVPELKLTVGTSFQNLEMLPTLQTQTAYAFTGDVQFRYRVRGGPGVRHTVGADYGVRAATSVLGGDARYTRQVVSADYAVTVGRQVFGFHVQGGRLTGTAPLFERFTLGNTVALRGWNKFDVAPLGGSRLAYASIEYRYRPFQIFYDVGTVWDPVEPTPLKHSIGVGLAGKDGWFISLAFPVRLHQVSPLLMFGYRG